MKVPNTLNCFRFFCFTLILSLFVFIPIYGQETSKTTPIIVQNSDPYTTNILASVKVLTENGSGSGTIINKKYILTANHVVFGASKIYILIPPQTTKVECSIEHSGNLYDLDYAILKIKNTESPLILPNQTNQNAELTNFTQLIPKDLFKSLKTGENLYTIGYPLGGELHIDAGKLCAKVDSFYTTSANIIYGNSGCGVFNEKHQLFAVMVRVAINRGQAFPHINFAVRLDKIYEDLAKYNKNYILTGEDKPEETQPNFPGFFDLERQSKKVFNIGDYSTIAIAEMFNLQK